MSRTHSNQKGFSVIEGFLIVVVVGLIGFVGWYVWHSKQAVDESLSNTGKSSTPAVTKDDPTASWKLFTAKDDVYSFRVADGWKLNYDGVATLYGNVSADLAGKPATITTVQGGRDGRVPFLVYYDENLKTQFTGYTAAGSAQSKDVEGSKYTLVTGETGSAGQADTPKGTKYYAYYFVKNGHGLYFNYSVTPTETDLVTTVEQMIKTATFK